MGENPKDIKITSRIDYSSGKIYMESDLVNSGDEFFLGINSKTMPIVLSVGGASGWFE